jgi:hypothetical protein
MTLFSSTGLREELKQTAALSITSNKDVVVANTNKTNTLNLVKKKKEHFSLAIRGLTAQLSSTQHIFITKPGNSTAIDLKVTFKNRCSDVDSIVARIVSR